MAREYRQNNVFVVELDESEWYGKAVERQEQIEEAARTTARAQGCQFIGIFVTPDPLFSMCGKDIRHRVYECTFPSAIEPFKVRAQFSGEIDAEVYYKLSERDQHKMLRTVRDRINEFANGVPGRYAISTDKGKLLETGRV